LGERIKNKVLMQYSRGDSPQTVSEINNMLKLFGKKTKSYIGGNLSGQPATVTVIDGETNQQIVGLTMHITEKCNFSCRHCYMSSNPNVNDTLEKKDIFSVVDQLNNKKYHTSGILISGGEPFLHQELDSIIKYASKRIKPIIVFTNGYWVSDIDKTRKRLKELRKLGCEHVKFSINDKYHQEFIGEEKRNVILELYQKPEKGFPLIELNHEKDEVDPRGKAISLPKEALKLNDDRNEDAYEDWDMPFYNPCNVAGRDLFRKANLSIKATGEVYPCGWFVRSLGNIKKDSIDTIVSNFWNDKEYESIVKQGPQAIARQRGMPEDEIRQRFLESPCKLCYDLYNN
jgi:MoaA/NifB/PqqE/SkfB family radical SAM enzyme